MRVSIFVTCLVDQFFPNVGVSMVQVLRSLGVQVEVPRRQTCCGQPLFNTGYRSEARTVAARFLDVFQDCDYIVAPSGSCTAMVRNYYPELFAHDEAQLRRVQALGGKLYEFSEFLVRVLGREDVGARFPSKVTYHDACHLLRELGIREEPRRLLARVGGLEFVESDNANLCCGFGGTFSVKFPEISAHMVEDKIAGILRSGAEVVIANDSSCLMQIAGALRRRNLPVRTMHLAEVLACR
ncbi:MAG: (Fe-S)-binding protein [Terriglobales bacterium]|jgi:L-lactate dehydrogenase complex protein LldE